MIKNHQLSLLFVIFACAFQDSNAMLSLKQTCHNALNNSLLLNCVNVICTHNIDGQYLPEDLQDEIQNRKDQINCLLVFALNGQKCIVRGYKKHIHSLSCVPELIQFGADVSTTNGNGQSALHIAAMTNNVSLTRFLLERCAPMDLQTFIHETDCDGNTPLHCAARKNAQESMSILIKAGADVNAQSEYGRTPLHRAAESDAVGSIAVLLKHEADIDALDDMGNTPLHLAARIDNFHAVKYLLNYGAQSDIKNKDNKTPLNFTRDLIHSQSEDLLKNWNKTQSL